MNNTYFGILVYGSFKAGPFNNLWVIMVIWSVYLSSSHISRRKR
jgi:hypothetical protein